MPAAPSLDVTGLTFDDVLATLEPPKASVRALRFGYRHAMRGSAAGDSQLAVTLPEVSARVDRDEVAKFAYRASDGLQFESVVVPMQHAQRRWKSVCVSCQVGCRYGCRFC